MKVIKTEFTFKSVSGLADIHAAKYIPENAEVKGVFQIAHGMAEHLERYEPFIDVLCENGYAVYINDHLGHGKSVTSDEELGYFGEKDGWKNFIEDCYQLLKIAKKDYGDKPYYFFGHSMGSFVSRSFTFKYADELTGAVFCGTSGPNPAAPIGAKVASLIGKVKGSHYRSKFIDNLAFGAYNKKFEGRTAFDWLSRDNDQVDKYIADKYCGFLFTAYGYRDMFSLLGSVSNDKWFTEYPKQLPVLIISGEMDPVGNYSVGVRQVYDKLREAGKSNVDLHIYPNGRHEILNEREAFGDVCRDVLAWAEKIKK